MESKEYNSFIKLDMNWGPRSDMILVGIPNRLKTCVRNNRATPLAVMCVVVGKSTFILVNKSTTTIMALYPFESGNSSIKSTEMISQG
jgi:hypothetical protein